MLVRFDAWSAGSKRRIRFLGSKAMILFTRRLMPAELRLQSDRETQKSEIYFTDYTLAGQPGAYSFWKSERACDPQGQSVHKVGPRRSPTLFHRLHFDWATRGLFVLEVRREQTIRRDSQYIRSAARRLPTLFHRLHFGWATGCFPLPRVRAASGGPGLISW